MAEYIDRDKLNKKKKYLLQTQEMPFPKSEYFIKVDDFWSVPTADVIERSEYDKLVKSFNARIENQKENLINLRSSYYALEKEYAELKVNINKAIAEISNIEQLAEYTCGDIKRMCVEIIKRNIEGE